MDSSETPSVPVEVVTTQAADTFLDKQRDALKASLGEQLIAKIDTHSIIAQIGVQPIDAALSQGIKATLQPTSTAPQTVVSNG